jgi:hypothetical protein
MTIMQAIGRLNRDVEIDVRAREFAALARCIMLAKDGNPAAVAEQAGLAKQIRGILARRERIYSIRPQEAARQRAAVAAGSTADSGWALPLAEYQTLASGFLQSLRHHGAFDKMLESMRRVPLRTRVGASTVGVTGSTIGQSMVKPISRLTLSGGTIDEQKVVCILVMTDELARFAATAAGDLFTRELQAGVATESDARFIALLTAGATSIGSSGATAEHVRNDLRALLTAITTSAGSTLFLLMPPAIAKILAVLHSNAGDAAFPQMGINGGEIVGGVIAIATDAMPASTMLLADAQQITAADDGVVLDVAREGLVMMDSAPDSPITASSVWTSLWQYSMVGLRCERYFGAQKLTSTGVAVLTGANYSGDSPGP